MKETTMKQAIVSALEFAEARLFAMKLWSCGTQAQKLKNFLKEG